MILTTAFQIIVQATGLIQANSDTHDKIIASAQSVQAACVEKKKDAKLAPDALQTLTQASRAFIGTREQIQQIAEANEELKKCEVKEVKK
jgi:hypothetical protein